MIALQNVTVQQGSFELSEINFAVPEGAYSILMGQTGCGKTTLLEAICGLRPISQGKIFADGQEITKQATSRRNIGYVPQDTVLFPAMRIDRQIEFALDVRKVKATERRKRVIELAELAGIKNILHRYPRGLSGGEKQRVALSRALAFRPRLLCLDEPLSALDDNTKLQISRLLKRIHQNEKVSILHVTHNAAEAKQLGTIHFRIEDGRVKQADE